MERFQSGDRLELQDLAARSGVSRMTLHRWFGSREGLVGEVLAQLGERIIDGVRANVGGSGASALLERFDRINRIMAGDPALRGYLRSEGQAALRMLTATDGPVQPRLVARVEAMIRTEEAAGAYAPPLDAATLAYAIVRLAEAFIYNDAAVDIRGEVDRLRAVEAALIGA